MIPDSVHTSKKLVAIIAMVTMNLSMEINLELHYKTSNSHNLVIEW